MFSDLRYIHAMTRIAILTPDPADRSYARDWPIVLERVAEALKATGATVVPTPWTDHIEDASGLGGFDLILPLLTWGYHRDHERWLQACATWDAAGVPVANPARTLAWNSDKAYLGELTDRGVPIPPTAFVDRVDAAAVEDALKRFGAPVIAKPTVSGGAWKTLRLTDASDLADAPEGAAMIQPYLAAIEAGELSLLYFGGRLSHAVLKRPADGDFRIQTQHGGTHVFVADPPAEAVCLAETVIAAAPEPLLYARIDLVRDPALGWLLMELEAIEPDFYLAHDPAGGAGFAEAVGARLNGV